MSEKSFKIGQRVELPVKETCGTVAYSGPTDFSTGKWIGVILDEPKGKNNGTVLGKTYFQCEDLYGVMVRSTQLKAIDDEAGTDSASEKSFSVSSPTTGIPAAAAATPLADKSKSSIKRKIEPTSLKRKPAGASVPQKPDKLRLPTVNKIAAFLQTPKRIPQYSCHNRSTTDKLESNLTEYSHFCLASSDVDLKSLPINLKPELKSLQISSIPEHLYIPHNSLAKSVISNSDSLNSQSESMLPLYNITTSMLPVETSSELISKTTLQNLKTSNTSMSQVLQQASLLSLRVKSMSQTSLSESSVKSSSSIGSSLNDFGQLEKDSPRIDILNVTDTCLKTCILKPSSALLYGRNNVALNSTPATPKISKESFLFPPTITGIKTTSSSKKIRETYKLPISGTPKSTPAKGDREVKVKKDLTPRSESKMKSSFTETGFVETLTPQYTPGTPSSTSIHLLEDKAATLQAVHQDVENLKAENQDLKDKLEALKVKRAEDKEKIKEGEKLKLQVEQLTEFKMKIMDSQAQLQRELQKAKQETKEALQAREEHAEETADLAESVEMLTLDKEMAEEKAEALQSELEQTKEKLEGVMLDLEILKAEMVAPTGAAGETSVSSAQMRAMEQHNERMKETLVKMRDMAAHEKHEFNKILKDMEAKIQEVIDLNRIKDSLQEQLLELQGVISDLQEQVDAALGAEEMVETLTDRNLDLEERLTELQEVVKDLEEMNDTNDQLQENAREVELELRQELDLVVARVRELTKERDAANEALVDLNRTVGKFRDLVQRMQEENENLRDSLHKETNRPVRTPAELIDFTKMFAETKAQSKAVEMEIRQLELSQATQHVKYLMHYMPDNFVTRGGDHDGILILMLVSRLAWKGEVVVGGLKEKFPMVESVTREAVLKTHSVEQYAFSARLLQLIYMVQTSLHQYEHVLNTCSVDVYMKVATCLSEMMAQERNVDLYVDLLKKDQLDENVPTEPLEKTVHYILCLFAAHLQDQKLNQSLLLHDTTKSVASGVDAIATYAKMAAALVHPKQVGSECHLLLTSLEKTCLEVVAVVKRLRRRLPQDGSAGPVNYPLHVQEQVTSAMTCVANLTRALWTVARSCVQQAQLNADMEGGISGEKLRELIHQATDAVYGKEDQGPDVLLSSLEKVATDLSSIASTLEKGEFDFDGSGSEKPTSPLVLRAESVKSELRDTEHLKYKLEAKEETLKELKVLLKVKGEELSEMVVRRDLAEKKLSNATRDSDLTIEKLHRKLDDSLMMLRRKEKEYEDDMAHLHNDIERAESDKVELREKLKNINKKVLFDAMAKSSGIPGGMLGSPILPTPSMVSVSSGMVTDSPMLLQQIADLKAALNHKNMQHHDAVAQRMVKQMASLKSIQLPVKNNSSERSQHLNTLLHQIQLLQKEINSVIGGPKIPDADDPNWSSKVMKNRLDHNHHINQLASRLHHLQDEVNRVEISSYENGSIKTAFNTFPTPQLKKALDEKDMMLVGRVYSSDLPHNETKKIILNSTQLKNLLNIFHDKQ